ncbi:MAG: ribonuclease III [Rhodospirillales bacterium]|nr:ribonuclease III [Rhodospirillales bacterium]
MTERRKTETFPSLRDLEAALGHRFADAALLTAALTHPSSTTGRRAKRDASAFERLEFLGDRVIGLIVAEMLCKQFPGESEGALARRHAALVNRDTLARVATAVRLGDFLQLSPDGAGAAAAREPGILADALEATIAALYRDGGLDAARAFIAWQFGALLTAPASPPQDAKTALQEWAQGRGRPLPAYKTMKKVGPAHRPRFAVEVSVEGLGSATAEGPSKRAAEQAAAETLLQQTKDMS